MGLAEDLVDYFQHDIKKIELIPGSGGVFEINVNGINVYSKKGTRIFPESQKIIEKMESL